MFQVAFSLGRVLWKDIINERSKTRRILQSVRAMLREDKAMDAYWETSHENKTSCNHFHPRTSTRLRFLRCACGATMKRVTIVTLTIRRAADSNKGDIADVYNYTWFLGRAERSGSDTRIVLTGEAGDNIEELEAQLESDEHVGEYEIDMSQECG